MHKMRPHIYNICNSCSFWDVLADIYTTRYANDDLGLAGVLFLLPNRRACQALTAAFVRKQGMRPSILPQIMPIAEIDDDDLFFNGFDVFSLFEEEGNTISREERLFLFTRLIMSKPNDFGLKQISLAQALSLAIDLANLIDTANNQGLSFDRLATLVPEKYAIHWQETLKLLKIITEFWPQILKERKAIDVSSFRNKILTRQAQLWHFNKTQQNVVAAGITANFPAIVELLKSIKDLTNGEIYFAGLDRFADESYWSAIDETHPQFELKTIIDLLELKREDIIDIVPAANVEREKFISEIMRPAVVSEKWRGLKGSLDISSAIKGLSLITCKTQRDEATAIALKMREVLTKDGKTAALVTCDRNLARRVAAELGRFNIKIDDSAGMPLHLSPVGIFLRQLAEAAEMPESEVLLISLLKNPFMLAGQNASDFRQQVYDYELRLRNSRKDQLQDQNKTFIKNITAELLPLSEALHSEHILFNEVLECHIRVAERLASSAEETGSRFLWRGDAGKKAAQFITKMLEATQTLGMISGRDYLPLLTELMGLESVRSAYGTHPRLSILGPIEARLCHFDYIILGEVNEGIWPQPAQADMWMSRPMKKDFGFSLPEKNIGILGADLCGFLAVENVIITRAERVDGVPMKKSRWLLRLETVLKALGSDIEALKDDAFVFWANKIDKPDSFEPIKAPAPCPPVNARPRKLSASGIDLLIQDPYSVFAKYILNLYPLDELDIPPDQRDYGTLIHAIIEEFNNRYPESLPENPVDVLLEIGQEHFNKAAMPKELEAFWLPKFINTAKWIIEQEQEYRPMVKRVHNEVSGKIVYDLPYGPFTFTAKADRIDELKNGGLNVIDYKTGQIPSEKQVKNGHAMQLLLEGLIAEKGNFDNMTTAKVNQLIYWQLGKKAQALTCEQDELLEECEEYLKKLLATFDLKETPYHPRPIPKFIPKNKDYVHLSRIKEWSVLEEGTDNDE